MPSCSGIKVGGGSCGAQAIQGSAYCFNHHPDYEQQRQRRASKGGRRGGRGRPQAELGSIKTRLLTLADDVLSGAVDRADAVAVGQLLNTVIRAVSVELRVREIEDLARRLEELEGQIAEQGEGRRYGA